MIRVSGEGLNVLALIKRAYLRDPIRLVYLIYDLIYYPDLTEAYLNIVGNEIVGFVLIFRGFGHPVYHIVGRVERVGDLIDVGGKSFIYVESYPSVIQAVLETLERRGVLGSARGWLTMTCRPESFRPYNSVPGLKRLGPDDVNAFISLKSIQGRRITPLEALMRLSSPHFHYYGVIVDGALACFGGTCLKMPEVWVICDVFTHPAYRGRGFAKAVVSAITQDAFRAGAFTMLHVYESNYPAIRAYRRVGFRAIARGIAIEVH